MLVLFGGTGFIGRHLCERAHAKSFKAVAVYRQTASDFLNVYAPSVEGCRADNSDLDSYLKQAKTVVYLANTSKPSTVDQSVSDIVSGDLNNIMNFTHNLFDINPDCQMIYLSSGGQIYGSTEPHPIPESTSTQPVTPYGLGKLLNETSLDFFRNFGGANILSLRLANPIGHWQVGTSHGFVSAAVNACLLKQELTVFGQGGNARDYFDVDDFAKFIGKLHHTSKTYSGTYNIGSGTAHTECDIINIIKEQLGRDIRVKFAPARGFDLPYAVLDVTRARTDLGWSPKTPLTQSIQKIARAVEHSAQLV
ncbi:NAD-dependent epimerase/dehydratase family protein [Robiginitomaculum antarcticum]|uniref:NAD-dependent epimerase/dehydratase family protein n=1 Tax=Robiginitomaculum antarcticum TaxID=437507 RepID=UPI0003AAAC6F|nr:NAD-dependent epimerase/dehydratase family protein [Robiginitomaculum antarcticum]